MERNGYDVKYWSGVDTHRFGERLADGREARLFISSSHDEYWSGPQRAHVTAARDRGVHMAFLTGNGIYWKVRWETSSADPDSEAAYRTLVVYKVKKEKK